MKEFAAALADFLKSKSEEPPAEKSAPAAEKPPAPPEKSAVGMPKPAVGPQRRTTRRRIQEGTDTDAGLNRSTRAMEVVCLCGQRLMAKRELAGKRVKCPRCSDVVTLPSHAAANSSPRHLVVACHHCGQRFLARGDLAGKAVRCAVCGRPLTVPKPGEAISARRQIEVTCVCGQQFMARPELAGRRVHCSSCGRPLVIPAG
jgi:ribosomal protein S27E